MIPLRQEVIDAYQAFLGRPPESEAAILDQQRGHASTIAMVQGLLGSPEGLARRTLVSGAARLGADEQALLARFAAPSAPLAGFVTDFNGTRTNVTFSTALAARDNTVASIPDVADAEAKTWLGLLAAVVDAQPRGHFNMTVFGAGYGQWAVRGLVAARQRGIARARLIASEPARSRVALIRQHLADNGFDIADYVVHHAAVGVSDGSALVPEADPCAPEPQPAALIGSRAVATPNADPAMAYARVDARAIGTLIGSERIDACHLRVGEAVSDILAGARHSFDTKVRRLSVETTSRRVEGELMTCLTGSLWELEHEHPCALERVNGTWRCTRAGVQVWRNVSVDVA